MFANVEHDAPETFRDTKLVPLRVTDTGEVFQFCHLYIIRQSFSLIKKVQRGGLEN
jgi:hypothetical protein